jgi:hypothetical protein
MEIGVYNAKNAETMIKTALKNHRANEIEYFGFDFFYNYSIELIRSKLEPFGCKFNLIKGNTLETIPEVVKFLPKMDIIFIDGGKSYMEAHNDWQGSSVLMHKATGVFVHNAGFSGVGRMVEEIPKEKYVVDLLYPRFEGKVARIMLRS